MTQHWRVKKRVIVLFSTSLVGFLGMDILRGGTMSLPYHPPPPPYYPFPVPTRVFSISPFFFFFFLSPLPASPFSLSLPFLPLHLIILRFLAFIFSTSLFLPLPFSPHYFSIFLPLIQQPPSSLISLLNSSIILIFPPYCFHSPTSVLHSPPFTLASCLYPSLPLSTFRVLSLRPFFSLPPRLPSITPSS